MVALVKGLSRKQLSSSSRYKRSHSPQELRQRTPSGKRKVSPPVKLTTLPSGSTSHGTGDGGGRRHCRAAEHHVLQTAGKKARSARVGRRRYTKPRSSGGRSDHGGEPRACAILRRVAATAAAGGRWSEVVGCWPSRLAAGEC